MSEQTRQSGWVVKSPKGRIIFTTFSSSRDAAMGRAMTEAERRYSTLIARNFQKWERAGFKVEKATMFIGDYLEVE